MNAMDFSFTADQKMLREHISQLLDEVCPPEYAESCDNNAQPPRDAYRRSPTMAGSD